MPHRIWQTGDIGHTIMMSPLRLGLVVGRNETWSFVRDLHQDWQQHYEVDVFEERFTASPFFKERLNRRLLQADLARFLNHHDVVFFEWASELLTVASRLPHSARIVTRLHRYELYQWADRIDWSGVDTIVFVSSQKRSEFLSRFPEQEAKCVIIPVGIDLDRFAFKPRPFGGVLGTLCHLVPRKRVYELILALYQLREDGCNLSLRIGGGLQEQHADYYFAMIDLVERLQLGDHVAFDGQISDTPAWLQTIDIFVSNSYSEGLQVAAMEAMASGCYVLSHWWVGADELLPEENLFLTERQLRQKICDYANLPPATQDEQKARLRRWVEQQFDHSEIAERVRALIEGPF